MARNSAVRRLRAVLVVAGWVSATAAVQAALGAEIESGTRLHDSGVDQRLQKPGQPAPRPPARSNETEWFDPWELVGV